MIHVHPTIKDSLNKSTETCTDCGNELDEDDLEEQYKNSDGNIICTNCADEYHSCDSCGEILHINDCYWFGDDVYCEHCFNEDFFYCVDCDNSFHRDDGNYIEGTGIVCSHCYDDGYAYCEICGENHSQDDCVYLEDVGYSVCNSCREEVAFECTDCGYWQHTNSRSEEDNEVCDMCMKERKPKFIHPLLYNKKT